MFRKSKKIIALFAISFLAIPYFAFAVLNNADFESGTIGSAPPNWLPFSLGSLTTGSGARTGGAGTKIITGQNPAGGGSIYQTELDLPLSQAAYPQTWSIVGWVRIDNAASFNFGWFGSASPYSPSGTNISTAPVLNTWTCLTVIHTWATVSAFADGWRDVQVNFLGNIDLDDFATYSYATPVEISSFSASGSDWCLQ